MKFEVGAGLKKAESLSNKYGFQVATLYFSGKPNGGNRLHKRAVNVHRRVNHRRERAFSTASAHTQGRIIRLAEGFRNKKADCHGSRSNPRPAWRPCPMMKTGGNVIINLFCKIGYHSPFLLTRKLETALGSLAPSWVIHDGITLIPCLPISSRFKFSKDADRHQIILTCIIRIPKMEQNENPFPRLSSVIFHRLTYVS